LFNAGMYGAALGPAVALYHTVADPGLPLAPRSVAAMAVAVASFALLNLLLISQLIATVEERRAAEVVGESSKTSTLAFLGNASVGLIGVALWLRAPVVPPAVLLPVATLYLAYRSTARESEERDRDQRRHRLTRARLRFTGRDPQLLSPLASGLAVSISNATRLAQIKEEKSKLEQILSHSSDGILLLDGKGRVRLWNQAMERITG